RQGNLIVHEGKPDTDAAKLQQQWQTLVQLAEVLGLEAQTNEAVASGDGLSDADIEALIEQRAAAKKAKDYAESDRIRDELSTQGITLIDKPGGVTAWHR
ncbi:MAG: cysteine--tRNA ligase, partial [Cyanobacteria bacterium J06553_1]